MAIGKKANIDLEDFTTYVTEQIQSKVSRDKIIANIVDKAKSYDLI